MLLITMLKALPADHHFANRAGYYLHDSRWHAFNSGGHIPKGAPIASHPEAAGQHAPAKHFTDEQWAKLKLPAENVNASSHNARLDRMRAMSEAGHVTGLVGSSFGTNTYGKAQAKIANTLLGMHGSKHQVKPGQRAGEHEAVRGNGEAVAPAVAAPAKKAKAPNKKLTTWLSRHGGPSGMASTLASMSPEHQEKLIDAMAHIGGVSADDVRALLAEKPTEAGHAEGDKWVMPLDAAIAEHKELVHVAETPSKADDAAQLKEQKEELGRMEGAKEPAPYAIKKIAGEPGDGHHYEVSWPGGKGRMQRLNSVETMGLPGWHDIDADGLHSYLADTKDVAAAELFNRRGGKQEPRMLLPAKADEPSPKEGDTKPAADGGTLVLRDGHWNKEFQIEETANNKQRRIDSGYTTLVQIDPKKFAAEFSNARGEALEHSPSRTVALKKLDGAVNDYPKVFLSHGTDTADVKDGRHRISLAAERGQSIVVAMTPDEAKKAEGKGWFAGVVGGETPASDAGETPANPPLPPFTGGTVGQSVIDYYNKVAQQVLSLSGDKEALAKLKADGMRPNAKGKVSNTWAGKTENSKMLLGLFERVMGGEARLAAPVPNQPSKDGDVNPNGSVDLSSKAKAAGVKGVRSGMEPSKLMAKIRAHVISEKASKWLDAGNASGLPQYKNVDKEAVRAFAEFVDANPYSVDVGAGWVFDGRGVPKADSFVHGGVLLEGDSKYKHKFSTAGKELAHKILSEKKANDAAVDSFVASLKPEQAAEPRLTLPVAPSVNNLKQALQAYIPTVSSSIERVLRGQFHTIETAVNGNWANIARSVHYKSWTERIRKLTNETKEKDPKMIGRFIYGYTLNDDRVKAAAESMAQEAVSAWEEKISTKLGELQEAEVKSLSGNRFLIIGKRGDHSVRIEQDMIVNASKNGTLFNQFPARISVDGKSISAEKYAEMFKGEQGPRDGDVNADGLVFRDGRWHRDEEEPTPGTHPRVHQAAKLRAAGQKVVEQAQAEQNRDRNTNTARRADMAGSILKRAAKDEAIGHTMMRIADAVEAGTATHLVEVTSKVAVETLESTLEQAILSSDRDLSYSQQLERRGRQPEEADFQNAKMPEAKWLEGERLGLMEKLKGKRGAKELASKIQWSNGPDSEILAGLKKFDLDKGIGWYALEQAKKAQRLTRLGIKSSSDLQEALREYAQFRAGAKKEDPIKAAERALVGQKNIGIDFFPTPVELAQRIADMAGIKPGMKVLEPGGGSGRLADAAKAAGGEVETYEVSSQLRNLLQLKGHKLVGHDFTEAPAVGQYDAVVMNPPFGNRADAAHIMQAFGMLKPGGTLVAVAGEGVFSGSDRKAVEFREWLDEHGAEVEKLPEGTFKESGTGVNTRLVKVVKASEPAKAQAEPAKPKSLNVHDVEFVAKYHNDYAYRYAIKNSGYRSVLDYVQARSPNDVGFQKQLWRAKALRYFSDNPKGKIDEFLQMNSQGKDGVAYDAVADLIREKVLTSGNAFDAAGRFTSRSAGKYWVNPEYDGDVEVSKNAIPSGVDDAVLARNEFTHAWSAMAPDARRAALRSVGVSDHMLASHSDGMSFPALPSHIRKELEKKGYVSSAFQHADAQKEYKPAKADTGPKDGDRNADGLVFRDGRWHREGEQAAKYSDGRTIPQVGDKVYTGARGFGGMPAVVRGEVRQGSAGLFVAIEGAQGMIGEQTSQKRVPLSPEWTLIGEEHPDERKMREAGERLDADAAKRKADRESMLNDAASRNGTLDPATVKVGDTLEMADGSRGAVTEIGENGDIYADDRYIGKDMRGIKVVRHPAPDIALAEAKADLADELLKNPGSEKVKELVQKVAQGEEAFKAPEPAAPEAKKPARKPRAKPASAQPDDLDPNSPNYRYRDTGYVAGSRKEDVTQQFRDAVKRGALIRLATIDWEEVEQNPRQAAELITKSHLFGKVDWESLKANGMEPGAGFLLDRVYAAVGTEPALTGPQARKDYALGLETLRDRMEKCKTPEQITTVLNDIKDEMAGVMLTADESAQYQAAVAKARERDAVAKAAQKEKDAVFRAWIDAGDKVQSLEREQENRVRRKWKADPDLDKNLAEARVEAEKANQAYIDFESTRPYLQSKQRQHANGYTSFSNDLEWDARRAWDEAAAIKKTAKMRNLTTNPTTRAWICLGKKFFSAIHYRGHGGSDAFAQHVTRAKSGKITDWSWAEGETVRVGKPSKREVQFRLAVAETFERKGGRDVRADSTLALKEQFGLRDVQSGNWVLNDPQSAAFHVQKTAEAFTDLADLLGVEPAHVSLNGRLAMAFGARGKGNTGFGGAHAAHYEPVHRIINMTKMSGGGMLAHEWFHAIDNIVKEAEGGGETGIDQYATENPAMVPAGELRDAFEGLRKAMTDGPHQAKERFAYTAQDLRMAKHNVDIYGSRGPGALIKSARNAEEALKSVDGYFTAQLAARPDDRKLKKTADTWRKLAVAYHDNNPAGAEVDVKAGAPMSSFALEARNLDGGAVGRYWSKGRELGARAFQSWVEDRLSDKGQRNDYLSAYADNKYHVDPMFGPSFPYPDGEERQRINAAFDVLMSVLAKRGTLAKAMLFM